MEKKLIVTHHAPDLDAIGSVWLLKRFGSHLYANASVSFVDPGAELSQDQAKVLGFDLNQVIHVDTGLGEFDHHQQERAKLKVCASSLIFDHLSKQMPDLKEDEALISIINYITEIDHFNEIYWPEPSSIRYKFMIHELIRGVEYTDPHNDEYQLRFGMSCLDNAYAVLVQHHKALNVLKQKANIYQIGEYHMLALESRNDDTVKIAQTQGFDIVVCKDPQRGNIRIKARPDSKIELKPLYEKIISLDQKGTWYYHNSGKMLLNGSYKHRNQVASPLTLAKVVETITNIYGKK